MPEEEYKHGFDDLMHDLEDNIFGLDQSEGKEPKGDVVPTPKRKETLPALVDKATAEKILKDFMREKNQRRYDIMGMELVFKPYWFFTYTAELIMRDENRNITDSEELGGRVAVDAVNGALADYLQDLIDHEPIEMVDLSDELSQVGGEAKVIDPKISEERMERFVKQKIAGVLKVDKENVEVAGFELMWSPVYRYWMTIKKRTHNVQVDGCGGYPINYDDVPARPKTWFDILQDDIMMLKDPKKWKELLSKKGKAARAAAISGGKSKRPGIGAMEAMVTLAIAILFIYGLSKKDLIMMSVAGVLTVLLFWYMNHRREKPLIPLPPPPFYGPGGA